MWIVRLALRNPYTTGVIAALIFMIGLLSLSMMKTDVLPAISIPVVNVVWSYNGLPAEDVENRVVFVAERGYTTSVNGIDRMESRSIPGLGIIRIYFQPDVDIGSAISQITSSSMTTLRIMPPGMQPPNIVQFDASSVPVAQLTIGGAGIPEEKLFDHAQNFVRMKLFTLPGLATPAPYGGKNRQINVDIMPDQLAAHGLSPQDVVNALSVSNLIIPAGQARIGGLDYNVVLNSSPGKIEDFNQIPIKTIGQQTITLGDVSHIGDTFADQTNIARIDGVRGTFLNIIRKQGASTLDVVRELKASLPGIKSAAPQGMDFKIDFDQSKFVKDSLIGVLVEGGIAALLVSLMILFFLGSWRSVFIVCTSIPLAILTSITGLAICGQTLNTMTLGGLSLAIGMLVDDATVEVENIHRNMDNENGGVSEAEGLAKKAATTPEAKAAKRAESELDSRGKLTMAILRAASQVALPAIMSTLAICLVFSPVILLTGPAKFLFSPMALAVIFAMLSSYILSRSLVPVLARMLLVNEGSRSAVNAPKAPSRRGERVKKSVFFGVVSGVRRMSSGFSSGFTKRVERFNSWRDAKFEKLQNGYEQLLHLFLDQKAVLFSAFILIFLTTLSLPVFVLGEDFFPQTDAGILKMHVRTRSGMRIEETEQEIARVEKMIHAIIPSTELQTVSAMIGMPLGYTLAFVSTDNMGPMDSEIQIQLKEKHQPTVGYTKKIREQFASNFPGSTLYFQPADLIDMVLNFGQSAMIDVQIESKKTADGVAVAKRLLEGVRSVPGLVDAHLAQVFDYPTLKIDVDRVRAAKLGLTQKDVAASMLISLSSSSLYAPSFYLNPENNVNYFVVAKVPLSKISSVEDLQRTPITSASSGGAQKFSSSLDSPASDSNGDSSQAVGSRADVVRSGVQEAPSQTLGSLADVSTGVSLAEIDHHNIQRVVDVTGGVEGRDLGSVVAGIEAQIKKLGPLPPGVTARVLGQSETMKEAFGRLALGMVIAIALVYLLMVVLFQSWIDPLIILLTLPGALMGILWMLTLTGTSINVVSLMGSVMAIGIAVSNSILLVSFANDLRHGTGEDEDSDIGALKAAVIAGKTRLRPVIMTALAMILGMLPMSLGLGAGGEQNAPLGRAVIGGLFFATLTTLFVVPVLYSILRRARPLKFAIRRQVHACEVIFDQESGDHSPQPAR